MGDAGEGLVDDDARDARGLRLARHRGEEGVEVAAALRGERGRGEEENGGKSRDDAGDHGEAFYPVMAGLVPAIHALFSR